VFSAGTTDIDFLKYYVQYLASLK